MGINSGKSKQLLTVGEAEALTGRKASTWRRDIQQRKVAVVRIGRQVRIPIEAIEQLIREGYCPAEAPKPDSAKEVTGGVVARVRDCLGKYLKGHEGG